MRSQLGYTGRSRQTQQWRDRVRRLGAGALVVALASGLGWTQATAAQAATVYEIEGNWQTDTPTVAKSGDELVSVWRVNINDDSPAPTNDPVDNVTVTLSTSNARFTRMPEICLVDAVDPVSSISADKSTLVCNLGTRDQGTAELILAGLQVSGDSGDEVLMSAEIGGASAALPPVGIVNEFAMDMKFDAGNPKSIKNGAPQTLEFPWSLRHSPGSTAGPDTVSYELDFSTMNGEVITIVGCAAQNSVHSEHPNSGPGFSSERTAPSAGSCTLTSLGNNRVRMTLSGIDYSKAQSPSLDSAGNSLPSEWDVVAAGVISVQFTYDKGTRTDFVASTPTYTSLIGETSTDLPENNTNGVSSTRGVWTGGWQLNRLVPAVPGTIWKDTFRTMAGQPAIAVAGIYPPELGASASTQVCSVVDSRYLDVTDVAMGVISGGVVAAYSGITYWYYTGNGTSNNMNPTHASYNPNTFTCEGTGAGWTTTKPANMSTVRAVKAIISPAAGANISEDIARLYVSSKIKDSVAVGQDVWTWTSYSASGGTTWNNPHRETDVSKAPASGVLTPGARYPFTGGGRDVFRIISATPKVKKTVDQAISRPGATVNYTISYRAEALTDITVPSMRIVDVLPVGMEYVAGSASTEPTNIDVVDGNVQLTWDLIDVAANADHPLTFSARVPGDAEPGVKYTNTVTATIGTQSATAQATTKIQDSGATMLTKTAAAAKVPHINGVAEGSWTVRVSSTDARAQTFTDTVDVLPHNGDGRGTSFSGTYALSAPVAAVAGASVYYSVADPLTLHDDPAHVSNGAAGSIAGNTVGWTTDFTPAATAVRVIGPSLPAGGMQEFTVALVTAGATFEDVYVNRAEARASRSQLLMRTSSRWEIGAVNSVALKKYVQDVAGDWHDANDIDDHPSFHTGSRVRYRLVVTNTGDQTLVNLQLNDDKVDLAALDPLPAGLEPDAVITELPPGADNAKVFEYEMLLTERPEGQTLVNTACVALSDPAAGEPAPEAPVEPSCDPAGITILPSSLSWLKVAAGSNAALSHSEWELTPVGSDNEPTGATIAVADCVTAGSCDGADADPDAGAFTVTPLADGRYRLVETRAPAGYQLDATPRYIDVVGAKSVEQPIENTVSPMPVIPFTGGLGSFGFAVGALILAGLVGVALWWQRRRAHAA